MTRTTDRPRLARRLAVLLLPFWLAGCNIVGTAAYVIEGPPKVAAQAPIDGARPTVIFIDDRTSRIPRRSLRVVIGTEAEEELIARKVIRQENMIASSSTLRAVLSESPDDPMSIADVGRAVGAEQVIYMTIDSWTLSKDSASFSPAVATRVKVIDAENRVRLWPPQEGGFPLRVEPSSRAAQLPRTRAESAAAEAELAKRVGIALARLFFEHEKDAVRDR